MRRSREAQILAIDDIPSRERLAVHFADVVHAANIGMRDLAGDSHFGVEAGEQIAGLDHVFGQEFERDGWSEAEVGGAIDLAHAAFADGPRMR